MKSYSRCKACGFIMETDRVGDVCPACGVPKTAFEQHKINVSENRKKLIDLHIHPIILHFPQAFAIFGLFLVILIPLVPQPLQDTLATTAKVLVTLLPFTVAAGFASGLFDGKLRFKKVTTPILKIKIFLGCAFLLFSTASAILVNWISIAGRFALLHIFLLLLCSACTSVLGKIGSSLTESKLPG
jgi:rubredoxin